MLDAKRAEFKFAKFQVPAFSYSETRKENTELKLQFDPQGKYFPKEGRFELTLNFIGFEERKKRTPVVKVTSVADFIFTNKIPFEEIPPYFYTNSIPILFPYLRAFVSTLTLQANTGVIMLRVMNFVDMSDPLRDNSVEVID